MWRVFGYLTNNPRLFNRSHFLMNCLRLTHFSFRVKLFLLPPLCPTQANLNLKCVAYFSARASKPTLNFVAYICGQFVK